MDAPFNSLSVTDKFFFVWYLVLFLVGLAIFLFIMHTDRSIEFSVKESDDKKITMTSDHMELAQK